MNELIVTFEGRNKLSEETKRVGALLLFPPTPETSAWGVENLMNDLNQDFLKSTRVDCFYSMGKDIRCIKIESKKIVVRCPNQHHNSLQDPGRLGNPRTPRVYPLACPN